MEENPHWTVTGIWILGKSWTGFKLIYGMGENLDWIMVRKWNIGTPGQDSDGIWNGRNPD